MRQYFTRNALWRPKSAAALLLLAFFAQTLWLIHTEVSSSLGMEVAEARRISEGWKQWHSRGIAGAPADDSEQPEIRDPFQNGPNGFDREHSPLLYLVSAAPLLAWPHALNQDTSPYWRWLPRLPFLACGLFLGASLWYVARRLCGNTGGLIALTLYCFSPAMIQGSAMWHTEPEIVGAWGTFGIVFTAIAVAHTLYAPREVILWNWRRIVLLGVAMTIAIGAQFSFVVVIPIALILLFYVAPVRRGAGFVIWAAACLIAFVLLFGLYFFHWQAFSGSMRVAEFWAETWRGFTVLGVYKQVAVQIGRACPVLALVFPAALVTYALWKRTRYFGNTAPLLIALLFLALAMAHPHTAGAGFLLASVPFLFLFVSGVMADLLETRYRPLVLGSILALLITYIAHTLMALAQAPRG